NEINHQNKFASTAVFTRSGRIPVSAVKPKAAASTSAAKPVNIAGPKQSVNYSRTTKLILLGQKQLVLLREMGLLLLTPQQGHPQQALKNKGIVDSGCSRHMTRNKVYLADYQEIHDGGFVSFGSSRDPLGKFKGKANEGFLVGYSVTSKAFRVFNSKTRKVEEKLHVRFLENKPNVAGTGPNCLFDIDSLTNSMNYIPVSAGNQIDKNAGPQDTNGNAVTQDNVDAGKEVSNQHYIVLPLWSSLSSTYKSSTDKPTDDKPKDDIGSKTIEEPVNKDDQAYRDELDRLMSQEKEASDAADALRKEFEQGCMDQRGVTKAGRTNSFNTVSNSVNVASTSGTFSAGGPSSPHPDAFIPANTLLHVNQDDSRIPDLEDTTELQSTGIFNGAYDDDLDKFDSLVQSVGA
nr:ribonuclease H-like domain-containing protein [Tanacetum cinerariifolium]